VSACRQANGSG